MKSTGHISDSFNKKPEKPFLKDLKGDLEQVNRYYNSKTATEIKKKMIATILDDI